MGIHVHGGDIYRYKNVIDFSSNCNPFGLPEGVKKAVINGIDEACYYPDVRWEALRKEISRKEQIEEKLIFCGNGAAELIFALTAAMKPKIALIPVPTFAEYEQALRAAGCRVRYYETKSDRNFEIEEDFLERITEEIEMVFLCNPNNPTGRLMKRDFLQKTAARCRDMGALLVIDECFLDFVDQPQDYTMKEFFPEYKNIFLLKAFTKLYAMAGIRLGYGLCPDQTLIKKLGEVVQPWNVSVLAQKAGIAALKEEEYVRKSLQFLKEEKIFLAEGMKELGYVIYEPAANFIFFRGPEDLWEKSMRRGILIRDCRNYPGLTAGYYRVAVRLREENEKLLAVLCESREV